MAKKYGAEFSREMDNDPNMGMNPKWRKKQGLKDPRIVSKGKDGKPKHLRIDV